MLSPARRSSHRRNVDAFARAQPYFDRFAPVVRGQLGCRIDGGCSPRREGLADAARVGKTKAPYRIGNVNGCASVLNVAASKSNASRGANSSQKYLNVSANTKLSIASSRSFVVTSLSAA